ncbi:MAG TPA: 2OG-Fe(II) oxygenase [Verrucomicrobiae bacterium]|nr:2OG-Fe(II) oxygenase [Verrucomicrobiae bacterium]
MKKSTVRNSAASGPYEAGKGELIQLTRKGVVFSGSAADLRELRAQFQRDHYIILPKLIEPDLFATILKRIESAPSERKEYDGIIAQTVIDDPLTYNLLLFLISSQEFRGLVQRITGCRRIADFQGRIYRLNPTTGERIVWHTDVYDHRMVTFSLNLTPQEYRGGTLQIRYRGSEEILHEVRNTGPGDALLMRVANKLFHRVLPVEGDVPRTAMAGWFRWEKENVNFHDALRKVSGVSPGGPSAD